MQAPTLLRLKTPPLPAGALRALCWALFVAAVLATALGTRLNHILSQDIWNPKGLIHLKSFALGYALWATAFLRFAPRWFAPASVAGVLVFAVAAVGPLAVVAVLLFLFSCFVTGSLLFERKGAAPVPALLRLLAGVAVWLNLIWVAVHFPINYPLVYVLALAAPAAARPRLTWDCLRRSAALFRPVRLANRAEYALLMLAGFPLLCHFLVSLKPEMGADALATHLMVPAWVQYHHFWAFDFRHISWAVMPLGADYCYTGVFMLGGEFAARLLNFAFLAITAGAIYDASRRRAPGAAALLGAALFASMPLVQLVTGSLMVENLWACLLFGALWALDLLHSTRDRRYLYLVSVLLGVGIATKFGSIPILVPIGVAAGCELARRDGALRSRRRAAAVALFLFVLFGSAPYLYAWAKTGNPVFPYMNTYFKSPYFDSNHPIMDRRYQEPISLKTPFLAVFQTHRYLESHDGALGLHPLVLLALGVAAALAGWDYFGWVALAVFLAASMLTLQAVNYVRYLYPELAMMAAFGAAALGRIARLDRLLYGFAVALLVLVVAANVTLLPSSSWYHPDFFLNPFDKAAVEEHYRHYSPYRRIVDYLNQQHPGETVTFLDDTAIAGFHGRAYCLSWHNRDYDNRVWRSRNAEGYSKLARELGLRYFVVRRNWETSFRPLPEFLTLYTDIEYSYGGVDVRRWKPEYDPWSGPRPAAVKPAPAPHLPEDFVAGPCDAGLIDDKARGLKYEGHWQSIDQYGDACGGTLTYTDDRDDTATYQFTGTGIVYVFTRAFNHGMVEVSIDGVPRSRVDQYAKGIEWRSRATFGGLSPGRHTLQIRVLHEKNRASKGFDVDLDGLVVTP